MNIVTEHDILRLIHDDAAAMRSLRAARTLYLPDWCIGAGFVRNRVWDALHNQLAWPMNDVDLIYYDPENKFPEETVQQQLREIEPEIPWEAVNQAFAHKLTGVSVPYTSTTDALAHWVETATCIGVRLERDDSLSLLAPYGIEDLVGLILRPGPYFSLEHPDFQRRYREKGWLKRWPMLLMKPQAA